MAKRNGNSTPEECNSANTGESSRGGVVMDLLHVVGGCLVPAWSPGVDRYCGADPRTKHTGGEV